jgi:hypothetical protein
MIARRNTCFCLLMSMFPLLSQNSRAQTVTATGQLLAEDSLQPLPQVMLTATSSTRPPVILQTTTGSDGGFSLVLTPGLTYQLCSAAIDNYVDSCSFYKPIEITAGADMLAVSMTAGVGTRMRVRIIDPDGLIRGPQSSLASPDPLLLLVVADEDITRTRIPLQLVPSATVSNAVEAAAVVPNTMSWHLGMSSVKAQLFDASGAIYQSNTPIPRPNNYGSNEFLTVFTIRAK